MVGDGIATVVEADAEQEVRRPDVVCGGVAEPVEHVVGTGRPEQAVAGAEPICAGSRTVGERLPRGVARGDNGVVERRVDALAVQDERDLRGEPGRVGDERHPLAGRAQAAHAVDRLRVGRPALVHHPPDVEDVAVIVGRERGQAGQDRDAVRRVHGAPLSHPAHGFAKRAAHGTGTGAWTGACRPGRCIASAPFYDDGQPGRPRGGRAWRVSR